MAWHLNQWWSIAGWTNRNKFRRNLNQNSHIAFKNVCKMTAIKSTQWGRVTHLCVSKLTTIGSDNGLSPGRRQAIIWTSAGILLIRSLGTTFSEILSEIHTFSFKKMYLNMSSAKWRQFCLDLNKLNVTSGYTPIAKIHYTIVSRARLTFTLEIRRSYKTGLLVTKRLVLS